MTSHRHIKRRPGTHRLHVALMFAVTFVSVGLAMDEGVAARAAAYELLVSTTSDRANAVALEGMIVTGNIYIFTTPTTGVARVRFFLDSPTMAGTPRQTENEAPYDFAGTASGGAAKAFSTTQVADGSHTVTAAIDLSAGGTTVRNATFTVANTPAALKFSPKTVALSAAEGGSTSAQVSLDDTQGTATYTVSENAAWLTVAPSSGTTPGTLTLSADATGLAPGSHTTTVTATATASGYLSDSLAVTLTVQASSSSYALLLSPSAGRTNPVALAGANVAGSIYVFTSPPAGVSRVRFFLDDPGMTGSPRQTENEAAYDFAGTASNGTAKPFNTTQIADGPHTITAAIDLGSGGTTVLNATFNVTNNPPALLFSPETVAVTVPEGGSGSTQINLNTTSGAANYTLAENAAWLTVSPSSGTTPVAVTLTANATGLAPGTYTATLTAAATGYSGDTVTVTLTVGDSGGCFPLACLDILVELPYELQFDQDHGKISDRDGVGTGFTYVDRPSNGTGYIPANLAVDTGAGVLRITTTAGLAYTTANSLDNALAVGIDAPSQVTVITTSLSNPPAGSGNSEQAGLWFGTNQDNYVKLIVLSTSKTSAKLEYRLEVNGTSNQVKTTSGLNLAGATVLLRLRADPADRSIAAFYRINGGTEQHLGTFTAPPEFFSFDGAGIDPQIGTRSFGGIFASHRNGPAPLTYTFGHFSVTADTSDPGSPSSGDIAFHRSSFGVSMPTSMVWGPDDRLYITEALGKIHAITFDANKNVVADQVITTLGSRLTLGITIDPFSTPDNVMLWVSHSSPSFNAGTPNSSTVTRLSGPGFTTREDVITGLPRAIANHAVNSIHFGPDNRLYIAQGGNTGAGAPNTANTEFGAMQEQPLSAAILVADVYAADFDGSCHNATDIFGPPPCHVVPYATGLRNAYDFVFHSNGSMYAPDNGLGVKGTYPPSPTPPCFGFGSTSQNDPGEQPDELFRVEPGMYHGHPNPYRNECVFKDGRHQGVAPLPNWNPPIANLGNHRSANGTVEYTADTFCGQLKGEILIANYSVGDNIMRIRLSPDGQSVVAMSSLIGGFGNPLPLTVGPDGTIYVGEFGGNKVTVLKPLEEGCWTTKRSLPHTILDSGGTGLDGKLYVVAGKTNSGHQSTLYIYDPATDSWTSGPNLPGPGVENPAVVALGGRLYVFGGSTAPFSGSVANAAVFDPQTFSWTTLAPMNTPRGGATAQAINGRIYVAGGMNSGASLATVETYDPSTNSWAPIASMAVRRDNPGSAMLGGKLYVFGGRTRDANGTTVNGTLASVEMYDPAAGTWAPRASMPTGRRTMVVGTLNGRAQVIGGEATSDGKTFPQNEEYDPGTDSWASLRDMPTPRHGAAGGTINNVVYAVGGGLVAGTSFTDVNQAFSIAP